MWLNATDSCCAKLNPEDCGWYMDGGFLKPTEFLGDPTPLQVDDILEGTNEEKEDHNSSEFDYNIKSSDE